MGLQIDTTFIKEYISIQKNLPLLMKASGVTIKDVLEVADMTRPTWHERLKNSSFKPKEMLAIISLINNKGIKKDVYSPLQLYSK